MSSLDYPMPRGHGPSAGWPAVRITIPFVSFAFARHVPITWYESLLLNAASYACIGLLIEAILKTARMTVARERN